MFVENKVSVSPKKKNGKNFKFLPINKKSTIEVLKRYADQTTIHGIRYVKVSNTIFEKTYWLLVIAISITVCTIFIVNVYNKWNRSPVIISFASKPTPVIKVNLRNYRKCFE